MNLHSPGQLKIELVIQSEVILQHARTADALTPFFGGIYRAAEFDRADLFVEKGATTHNHGRVKRVGGTGTR